MTDLDVLEELQDLFGGSLVSTKTAKAHHKPAWTWAVQGDAAELAMKAVFPYMFQRRREAILTALEKWQDRKNVLEAARLRGEAAAKAYLEGKGSLRQVGKQFDVAYETVRSHAKRLSSRP